MVERSATLLRPLKNHNYLRQVVWQLADQADAQQEQKVRHGEVSGSLKARTSSDNEMSEVMRKYIELNGDGHGE